MHSHLTDDLATTAFWLERVHATALPDPEMVTVAHRVGFAIDAVWRAVHELERLERSNDGLTRQILNDMFDAPAAEGTHDD